MALIDITPEFNDIFCEYLQNMRKRIENSIQKHKEDPNLKGDRKEKVIEKAESKLARLNLQEMKLKVEISS